MKSYNHHHVSKVNSPTDIGSVCHTTPVHGRTDIRLSQVEAAIFFKIPKLDLHSPSRRRSSTQSTRTWTTHQTLRPMTINRN